MMKRLPIIYLALLTIAFIVSCSTQGPIQPDRLADSVQGNQPVRWLVMLDNTADAVLCASELQNRGAAVDHIYLHAVNGLAVRISEQALTYLQSNPRVKLIEPDMLMGIFAPGGEKGPPEGKGGKGEEHPPQVIPSGVQRIGADLNSNRGTGVEVAVLDTGITLKHADLAGNILGGINFINPKKNANDDNGHGTHVAGIIAAIDNEIGVVGVAPEAKLWAVKVLNSSGTGWLSDIIAGVDWVTSNASHIDIANMSLGGWGTSNTFHAAIQNCVNAGVTVVVSAGNEYDNAAYYIPASYSEVICVSGIRDTNDAFYHWSNWGSVVDLAAPGVEIFSTLPGGKGLGLYGNETGTSMASPHVAGAAALYVASHPSASPAQVIVGLQVAGYLPPGPWPDDPIVAGYHPDPDGVGEKLVIASSL